MLCWSIALCFLRGGSLVQKQKNCLSPVLLLAWADLAQSWWYQHEVVQPQAMRTWGFPGLAASQQSSLMHEIVQVTYWEHCMGLLVVHAPGTRKQSVPWQCSVCTLLFYLLWGGCVGNTGRDSSVFKTFFSRYSGAELSFLVHCVYWSKSSSLRMNLCFKRGKSQTKRNRWERGEPSGLLNTAVGQFCFAHLDRASLSIPRLHSLRSLSLHNNLLTYLPREILNLVHLEELSLRGNPLVVRFVRDLTYNPPSLQELAGRTVKTRNVPYAPSDLPDSLVRYLSLASNCPNPKCGGKFTCTALLPAGFLSFWFAVTL